MTVKKKTVSRARTPESRAVRKAVTAARDLIQVEAAAVQGLRHRLDHGFQKAVTLLLATEGKVMLTGIGKSGLIARKISATLASTGSPALFVHAAEAGHGDLGILARGDVVMAVSRSGKTREVLALVPAIKRLGCPLIALTGEVNSPLGACSDAVLDASVLREACPLGLAPTASTTAALVMGDALAVGLLTARGFTQKDFSTLHPAGSLGKRFLLTRDLMHTGEEIPSVKPGARLGELIFEMSSRRLGVACVMKGRKLAGIVTDGDLRRFLERCESRGTVDMTIRAADVMTVNPVVMKPDSLAAEALAMMEKKKITCLVVVDDKARVTGILHLHDLLKAGIDSWNR